MRKREKLALSLSLFMALGAGVTRQAGAMHIMEGFLPPSHCVAWGVICLPFLVWGVIRIKNITRDHRKALLLLAMCGAYAFVLSALKIPSVNGSSSHPTGTGLGAMLFGPSVMAVLGIIVLLFQALLLAHGGLTTLGANTFSMAIAGPFLTYGVWKLCQKMGMKREISVFLGAMLGDLFTYCITSFQLGLSHPGTSGVWSSTMEFMGIFALTQVPLAIIEGIVTVVVVMGLDHYAQPELRDLARRRCEEGAR